MIRYEGRPKFADKNTRMAQFLPQAIVNSPVTIFL
jgi:hypothetical protein